MNNTWLTEEPSTRLSASKRVLAAIATAAGLAILAACGGGGGGQGGSTPGVMPALQASGQPIAQATSTATPTPTVTTTGTVVSVQSGYFVLSPAAPHGKVNVYTNAATQYVGAKPYAGESVTVYANGAWGSSASFTAIWVTQAGLATPTPGPTPTPVPTVGPLATSTPVPSPTGTMVPTITSTGSIVSVQSNYFVFNPGPPHGKLNIYTSASTQYIGAKPYAGEAVSINATGSWGCGCTYTAVWVAQSGFATPTPIAAPTPVATSTPVPLTNVPVHIATWAFDEYWAGGSNASSSAVEKYLTYAEGGLGNQKAQQDCNTSPKSCHSVAYTNPNLLYNDLGCPRKPDQQFIGAGDESFFVHQAGYSDAAHRVAGTYTRTCNGASETMAVYLADQANPAVVNFFQSYIQQNLDNWDYYWMDATKTSVAGQAFGPGGSFCAGVSACSTTQEYPTDASVLAAHMSFGDTITHSNGSPLQWFFNGFGITAGSITNQNILQADPSHFVGGVCENCIVNNGVLQTANYVPVLNAMLQINGMPGEQFVQLDTGESASGSAAQISQRTTALAVAWLGYSDGHEVIFPNFEYNTENLGVWPEDLVYPGAPVQTMQWSANDIQAAGGVYRREFRQCFYNQQPIGPCAAILNANSSAVTVSSTWLTQTYAHQISVQGGDILSGGSLSTTSTAFSPNVTTVPAGQAVLLAQ